jgi:ribosome biogenesis GTPase A
LYFENSKRKAMSNSGLGASSVVAESVAQAMVKYSWFPGHMYTATRELYKRLNDIDVFIEIRDARLPYSSLNYEVDNLLQDKQKRKIVIFNKYDLCHNSVTHVAIKRLQKLGVEAIPTSAINRLNLRKIIEMSRLKNPPKYQQTVGSWLMIGGMPNVGKSTILNTMRQQAARLKNGEITKSTKTPGQTRHLFGFRVNDKPLAWMVDTPGLMVPNIDDPEIGIKLALVGCVKESMVEKELLVNYLIEQLHKRNNYTYMKKYGLTEKVKNGKD